VARSGGGARVYGLSGVVRAFVQQCVTGGKCMMKDNAPQMVKHKTLAGVDAVSLYPAAMKEMPGFLLGKPNIIPQNIESDELEQLIGHGRKGAWFAEIEILHVKTHWQMPICNYVSASKERVFTNAMVGKRMFTTSVTAADMRTMQGIRYRVIRGYYWNEGFNTGIRDFITTIFRERRLMQKAGNPLQLTYKLMMNGTYGRLILKPTDTREVFLNHDQWQAALAQWSNIKSFILLPRNPHCAMDKQARYLVTLYKKPGFHWAAPHLGSMILDHSKRIMNRVHHIAHQHNIPIYYMDTDSIHMLDKDVQRLSDVFKDVYTDINDGELIGTKLGQFHNDFSLKPLLPNKQWPKFNPQNIRSVGFMVSSKKVYIHKLEVAAENGETLTGYSFAAKGFTEASVYDACLRHGPIVLNPDFDINDPDAKDTEMTLPSAKLLHELYEDVWNGHEFKLDLLAGGRPSFQTDANMKVSSRLTMFRTLRRKTGGRKRQR